MFIYKDEKLALEELNYSGSDTECESGHELDNQIEFMRLNEDACKRNIDEDFFHTFEDDGLDYGYGEYTWQLSKLAIEKIMILVDKNTCYRGPWDYERHCPYYTKYAEADYTKNTEAYKNEILDYLTKAWNFVVYDCKIVVCHFSH